MTISKLAKKLVIHEGQRIAIVNMPPGFEPLLNPLPDEVVIVKEIEPELEFLLLFVKNSSELREFGPRAIRAVKHDGVFWIAYPKKSSKLKSDLTRDVGWEIMKRAGLDVVTQVAIDETWSASRFRPEQLIGKGRKT